MALTELLKACRLCPRSCGVNRLSGERGVCGAGAVIRAARAGLHFWEEPCLSGKGGSGTLFFSHCPLKCVYCQNGEISAGGAGREITEERLAQIFLELQEKGAENINLVTAVHYLPHILPALDTARRKGLRLPVVYNSSGYERVETIKLLAGYVDVYLPDLKYYNDTYAVRYSNAPGYFETATKAIAEMVRQAGAAEYDGRGMMRRGVIVRHLMLPHLLFDSKKIVDYLFRTYGNSVTVSIMNQYTPHGNLTRFPELSAPVPAGHYAALVDYAAGLGLTNAYVQEGGTVSESFIPAFDGEGL